MILMFEATRPSARPGPLKLRAWLALAAIALGGCGRACSEGVSKVKAHMKTPPIETSRKEVERQLPTARDIASTLCGVPAAGFREVKFASQSETMARATFQIEATPILDAPRPAAGASAGLDVTKALLCVGVISISASAIVNDKNEVTGFTFSPLRVESVATPGVDFKPPASRHHHHG